MKFYYVYLLQGIDDPNAIYIGFTDDVQRRLHQHNQASNKGYTGKLQWKLVYFEAFLAKEDAQRREKRLKQHGLAKRHMLKRAECSLGKNI